MARIAGVDLPKRQTCRDRFDLYLWNWKNKRKPYFSRGRESIRALA